MISDLELEDQLILMIFILNNLFVIFPNSVISVHSAGKQRCGPVQLGAAHPGRARRHRPQHLPRPPRVGRPQRPPADGQQQCQSQDVYSSKGK